MKSYARLSELKNDEYLKQAGEFEQIACNVLQKCFDQNHDKINSLLVNKVTVFGNTSALDIAISANAIEFVSHPACQNLFNCIWYGRIEHDTSQLGVFNLIYK